MTGKPEGKVPFLCNHEKKTTHTQRERERTKEEKKRRERECRMPP